MKKIKIAVLCSGGGTNFQAIVNAQQAGMIPSGEVVLVVTDKRDAYVLTRAARYGIESVVVDRKEAPDRAEREKRILAELQARGIEFIVFAGFMTILSGNFVKHYPGRIINVHPALIPSFCGEGMYGLHVHEAVLARGDKKVCEAVRLAYLNGCKFDGWGKELNREGWLEAFRQAGVSPEDYTRERDESEVLPWDYIDVGVTKKFLLAERKRAYAGKVTGSCLSSCKGCGLQSDCPAAGGEK